jgi:cephalosporin hydroxylase
MVNAKLSLDDIANKYCTDKGTDYKGETVHGYAPIYERYLQKWRDEPIRMLEVGICMEGTVGGHSVRMWSEYFEKASIYTFDIVDMSKNPAITECERVKFFKGDQGKSEDLNLMYSEFGNKSFDFILEDGSHQVHHQMISLGVLFKYVSSGGYYILEDMSIPGIKNCCVMNDPVYEMLQDFKNNGIIETPFISFEDKKYLVEHIASVDIYHDIKDKTAVAIITKK